MSGFHMVNHGVNNFKNEVHVAMKNNVQSSEFNRRNFDSHDRMQIGDRRDKLYYARTRELNVKRNRNEIDEESYKAYMKTLNGLTKNEENETEAETENTDSEVVIINDNNISDRIEKRVQTRGSESQNELNETLKSRIQTRNVEIQIHEIFNLIYPVGSIYTRNINEMPFTQGKWEKIQLHDYEEDDEEETFSWVRII